MKFKLALAIPLLFFLFSFELPANTQVTVGAGGGTPGTSQNFTLVGSNPLFNRGMNAIFDHFVYIGNRTDGSSAAVLEIHAAPLTVSILARTSIRAS
jgi:hypothetical protein